MKHHHTIDHRGERGHDLGARHAAHDAGGVHQQRRRAGPRHQPPDRLDQRQPEAARVQGAERFQRDRVPAIAKPPAQRERPRYAKRRRSRIGGNGEDGNTGLRQLRPQLGRQGRLAAARCAHEQQPTAGQFGGPGAERREGRRIHGHLGRAWPRGRGGANRSRATWTRLAPCAGFVGVCGRGGGGSSHATLQGGVVRAGRLGALRWMLDCIPPHYGAAR